MNDPIYNNESQEINITFIFRHLIKNFKLVSLVTFIFAVISVIYALSLSNIYKSSSLLQIANIKDTEFNQNGGALSGLASLVGVSIGNQSSEVSKDSLVTETIKSRDFFKSILDKSSMIHLMAAKGYSYEENAIIIDKTKYDHENDIWLSKNGISTPPPFLEIYEEYVDGLSVYFNKRTGLLELSFEHYSPYFAQDFVFKIINALNAKLREKDFLASQESIDYLINLDTQNVSLKNSASALLQRELQKQMLTQIRDEYYIEIIDAPHLPIKKAKPSRASICIAITMLGFFIGLILSIFLRRIK